MRRRAYLQWNSVEECLQRNAVEEWRRLDVERPSVSTSTNVGVLTAAAAHGGVARSPQRASGVDAVNGGADNTSGVLAAVETAGGATLPFTGFPLWLVSLVAIVVTGGGLAIRRQARSVA